MFQKTLRVSQRHTIIVIRMSAIGDLLIAVHALSHLIASGHDVYLVTSMSLRPIATLIRGLKGVFLLGDHSLYLNENGEETDLHAFSCSSQPPGPIILDLQSTTRSRKAIREVLSKLPILQKTAVIQTVPKRTLARFFIVLRSYFSTQKPRHISSQTERIHDIQGQAALELLDSIAETKTLPTPVQDIFVPPTLTLSDLHPDLSARNYCVLFIGGSGPLKQWPARNFASCLQRLEALGWPTVLLGSSSDQRVYQEICDILDQEDKTNPPEKPQRLAFVGTLNLQESLFMISQAACLVTGDSFPAHAAELFKVPAVVMFGGTSPAFGFAPQGNNIHVLYQSLGCSPCTRHGAGTCRYKNLLCLQGIDGKEVAELVKKQIALTASIRTPDVLWFCQNRVKAEC